MMLTNLSRTKLSRIVQPFVLVIMTATLGACDFHLRGSAGYGLPTAYQSLQVIVPHGTPLESWIREELTTMHAHLDVSGAPKLHVLAVRPTHMELSGPITEIQTGVEVDYRMEDAEGAALTDIRTVVVRRNYQYNRNSVGIQSQQDDALRSGIYEDAARQIIRQISVAQTTPVSAS